MLHTALKVLEGKHAGNTIPLAVGSFLVGRELDCHLRPNSEMVSRHHCVFKVDDYTVRLRDLGSTNGTYVNDNRIKNAATLEDGDRIQIGKLIFQIVIEQMQETEQSETAQGDTFTLAAQETSVPVPPSPQSPAILEDSSIHTPSLDALNTGGGTTIISTVQIPPEGMVPQQPPVPQQGVMPGQPYPQQPVAMPPGYPPAQVPYPPQGYPAQPFPGMMPYPPQQPMVPMPPQPMPGQQPVPGGQQQAGQVPAPPVKLPPPPTDK